MREEKKKQEKAKANGIDYQLETGKAKIKSQDLDKDTGMKMVFITASPVLTNEVKRFYANLKKHLKHHLKLKEEKQEEKEK
jgi:hypothetical protein